MEEVLPPETRGRGVEIRKHQARISGVGQRGCITSFILPGLKVRGFGGANTDQAHGEFSKAETNAACALAFLPARIGGARASRVPRNWPTLRGVHCLLEVRQ